jgi:CRP-like cAMP-binding protein
MPAACLWEILESHPSATAIMLKQLTRQVRALTERVFEFSTLAVKNRIHAELLRLARDHMVDDVTAVIVPSPTHADIASRISTHREAVTRELTELSRQGLVERRHGSLVVRDVPRLERMVREPPRVPFGGADRAPVTCSQGGAICLYSPANLS